MQNRLKIKLEIVPTPNNLAALSTFFGSLDTDRPLDLAEKMEALGARKENKVLFNEVALNTPSTLAALEETPKPKKEKAEVPVKPEKKEESKTSNPSISIESLKEQTNEKAKAGHRDALRKKLDELGATSVSALAAEHYADYDAFLKSL